MNKQQFDQSGQPAQLLYKPRYQFFLWWFFSIVTIVGGGYFMALQAKETAVKPDGESAEMIQAEVKPTADNDSGNTEKPIEKLLNTSSTDHFKQALTASETVGEAQQDSPEEHAAKHADPTYICPMHPQIQQGEPGGCPICGMDLVLKDMNAQAGDGLPVVSVSASTAQTMGVRIGKVRKRNMARSVKTVGYVQYDEDKVSHLHVRAAGWIKQAEVKALGETVEQGTTLAQYYAPDIHTAQENYLTALRASSDRQRQIDTLTRLRVLEVPQHMIRTLEQEARITPYMPVTAPISGVVTMIGAQEGNYVTPGNVMYSIADLSSVWVIVDVFPEQANWIDRKARATMTIDALPDAEWSGRVDYVYPELHPQTRTLQVRLKFSNEDGRLKPNMFANVKIVSRPATGIPAIPREALIPSGDGYRVVKVTEESHYKPIEVKIGLRTVSSVEILEGLEVNDEVVLSGQFLIDSESNLQASFRRMAQ